MASEVPTDKGRIDLVLKTKTTVYIFELKIDVPASKALEQIEQKRYFEKYQYTNKRIVLVGLSFSGAKDNLSLNYAVKDISE